MTRVTDGRFKAKVLVRDLKKNKSQVINMDLTAADPDQMRIDVTSTLGMHLFSLVSEEKNVEYLVVREKKHYKGRPSSRALRPVLSVPLNPNHLRNVILRRPIAEKSWSCDEDPRGQLTSCKNLRNKMSIDWKRNKDGRPLILITYPRVAKVQINVRDYERFRGDPETTFNLKVPKSFKSYRLR